MSLRARIIGGGLAHGLNLAAALALSTATISGQPALGPNQVIMCPAGWHEAKDPRPGKRRRKQDRIDSGHSWRVI